jgi:hypothetical protein
MAREATNRRRDMDSGYQVDDIDMTAPVGCDEDYATELLQLSRPAMHYG